MKYIDYMRLNPFQRFWYNLSNFFKAIPGAVKKFFVAIGTFFVKFFKGIGTGVSGYVSRFIKGDWATKLSYIFMGFGNMVKGQLIKGLLFFVIEVDRCSTAKILHLDRIVGIFGDYNFFAVTLSGFVNRV